MKSSDSRADWPQIQDILHNHDAQRPPASFDLAGRIFELAGEFCGRLSFEARECELLNSGSGPLRMSYEALPIRNGLYFVDSVVEAERCSRSIILDLNRRRALWVTARMPSPVGAQTPLLDRLAKRRSQSAVEVDYVQVSLDGAASDPFPRTRALIGKCLRCTYSDTHIYEHIYHSERYYSWFCRMGPDQGLGDFEECDVFELGNELYLVSWREKLLPCIGVTVEDHRVMRSIGKICGADAYSGNIGNRLVGGSLSLLADLATQ